jgi:hypothetical protein
LFTDSTFSCCSRSSCRVRSSSRFCCCTSSTGEEAVWAARVLAMCAACAGVTKAALSGSSFCSTMLVPRAVDLMVKWSIRRREPTMPRPMPVEER